MRIYLALHFFCVLSLSPDSTMAKEYGDEISDGFDKETEKGMPSPTDQYIIPGACVINVFDF